MNLGTLRSHHQRHEHVEPISTTYPLFDLADDVSKTKRPGERIEWHIYQRAAPTSGHETTLPRLGPLSSQRRNLHKRPPVLVAFRHPPGARRS